MDKYCGLSSFSSLLNFYPMCYAYLQRIDKSKEMGGFLLLEHDLYAILALMIKITLRTATIL